MEHGSKKKQRLQQGFLAALALLAAYLCLTIVQPFLMPVIAATALAILFHPVFGWLCRRGLGRNVAAGLSVLFVVLATLIPAVLLSTAVARELKDLYAILATKSSAGGGWEPWLTHLLERPLGWFGMDVADPEFNLKSMILGWVEAASATLVRILRSAVANMAGVLMDAIVALFSLFFLFRDGDHIRKTIIEMMPLEAGQVERLFSEIGLTVIANMYGVGAVAAVQGGLTGVTFFLLGLHSPVLWGVVAGLCSMIPLVGPPIVWAPAAIYLAVSGQYVKAAVLVAIGAGVIGLADNFIRPYVISGQVKLHPLLIFFALLGGAQSFGLMGLFIGPAALSVTVALIELLREPAPQIQTTG